MSFFPALQPTFNSEKFVSRSIQSVLNQTYDKWEFFSDSRIKLFQLNHNSGASVARNESIKNMSGDFICFLDSDDEWIPTKL